MSGEFAASLTQRSRAHLFNQTENQPHYVYRCYDKDGDLLYIGCTVEVKKRIATHRRGGKAASRWLAVFMDRYEVEGPFRNRDAGRAAERQAIQDEQPLFNLQETRNASWQQRYPIAQYLVERGHVELAMETVCECWRETRETGAYDYFCVAHKAASAAGLTDLTERGAA